MKINDATAAQIAASDPMASTWLTANAGSGKTKVLTDRVARLLLLGADPQAVLCLTYTKAAAAEMQNRLFRRLGAWAMLPEDDLKEALKNIGVAGEPDVSRARTLFARAIEVPGGLKIQTIHAFAATILRRFPLEAGLSPDFRELDDVGAETLRRTVVDSLSITQPDAIAGLAKYASGDDLDEFAQAIAAKRESFRPDPTRATVAATLRVDPDLTPEVLAQSLIGPDGAGLIGHLKLALAEGGETDKKALNRLNSIDLGSFGPTEHELLEGLFLFKSGKRALEAKIDAFPGKAARERMGLQQDALNAMMARAEALREPRLALNALDRTLALHRFASAFLPAYETAKAVRGVLDFDDLIAKAEALLSDQSVANWVLYRIDGDIEHILVDEAQDTSPAQWRLIETLTQELTAGQGAETSVPRSIFVVGDRKQSIYSFQGADPKEMERMAGHYQTRLAGDRSLSRRELLFSFRSSPAILRVVDCAFAPLAGPALGGATAHSAFRADLPGRVDLWPIEETIDAPDDPRWSDPVDIVRPEHHIARLSRKIAREIVHWTKTESIPAENGKFRPVNDSDVLILLRKRGPLFHQIIRACKEAGLNVAGADRIRLHDELAVKDIMSVIGFLALPEDDLALAEALRSPLFGWSEDDLFRLAHDRQGAFLWQAMRAHPDDFGETLGVLNDLRDQSDFLRPYEIIERLLTRHNGRAALLARLGPEANEGIDALLAQAMLYETQFVPSLSGFAAWLDASDIEIKRQSASADAGLRVMTVHGAKGLESPIVILPETLAETPRRDTLVFDDGGEPMLPAAKSERSDAVEAATRSRMAAAEEERLRLLYVGMTRAEHWLVAAGPGQRPKNGTSWYEIIEAGINGAGATLNVTLADGTVFRRLEEGSWGFAKRVRRPENAEAPEMPPWCGVMRAPPDKSKPLSPSDLGGPKAIDSEDGLSPELAMKFGAALHLLLERLPEVSAAHRMALADRLLPDLELPDRQKVTAAAISLLDMPHLADVFGPKSLPEVELAATPGALGSRRVFGAVDRLLVDDTKVTAIDFKSNRAVPNSAGDVPEGILRQMAAYQAALEDIFPDRAVETAILWTATGELMTLPHDIVREALQRAAIS